MLAVILHNGNQYEVVPGKEYNFDLMDDLTEGQKEIVFSEIMLVADDKDKTTVGSPIVAGASVTAEIVGTVRGEKTTGIKFHAKKHYMRTLGHREDYTRIKVLSINNNEK